MHQSDILKKLESCNDYRIVKTLHFKQFKQPFEQIADTIRLLPKLS